MTPAEIVLDASVAVRGLVGESSAATDVADAILSGESSAHAPELIVAEVTNALRMRVTPGQWSVEDAARALDAFLAWPLDIHSSTPIASATLLLAVERGLSAYDAFYATLAEAIRAPLVTADRRLAGVVPESVLVE